MIFTIEALGAWKGDIIGKDLGLRRIHVERLPNSYKVLLPMLIPFVDGPALLLLPFGVSQQIFGTRTSQILGQLQETYNSSCRFSSPVFARMYKVKVTVRLMHWLWIGWPSRFKIEGRGSMIFLILSSLALGELDLLYFLYRRSTIKRKPFQQSSPQKSTFCHTKHKAYWTPTLIHSIFIHYHHFD